MKNPFKKISKKTVLIASTLVVLIAIPVSIYFLTREQGDVKSWYSSSWMYRRAITVSNPGATLSNEDVLITIDTQTLISASKLQSDCGDLRFLDSDDTSLLSYWIEDDCGTTSTKVWIRVPSLPSGGKTVYVYYGNPSIANGTLAWTGNVMMYADTTCPTGWTAASALNGRFLYGSSSYGTTSGSSTNTHNTLSCTSSSISTTNIAGSTISGITSTNTTHTHTGLSATVTASTSLPSYRDMIVCYNTHFTLNGGLISLFDNTTPTGWTRFTALDNVFPQANSTYGGTGGASTHTHATTGGTTAGPSASANTSSTPFNGTGGTITYSGGNKIHRFTGSGTFGANVAASVAVLVVAGGGGGGVDRGGGGGAGGVTYNAALSIASGNHTVTIGGGGAGSCTNGTGGSNGANSSFGSYYTTTGGGGGGSYGGPSGIAGGSGGGGASATNYTTGGTGTTNQGNNGGTGQPGVPYTGGGGGGRGGAGGTGSGGVGWANSITGTSLYYAGGGGGRLGTGGSGGGGDGSNGSSTYAVAGTANTGGGGGGGGGNGTYKCGAAGGSGVVIVSYPTPLTLSGTGASGTHTHSVTSVSVSPESNNPPYLGMVVAKANSSVYVNEKNVLIASSLPPLGWNRFTALDNKFVMGAASYGATGGSNTHTHSTTLTTGGPSATVSIYGSGANFASSVHTHSCSVNTNSASNVPPYYTVLYIQRKTSVSITVLQEEMYNLAPTVPTALLTEGATNPTGVTDLTPEFSAIYNDPDSGNTSSYYEIEVNTTSAFNGTVMWDSGKTAMTNVTNGARIADKSYAGTTLSTNGATYYWRIRLWDQDDAVSPWSATAQFTMNNTPTAPTALLTEGATNPSGVTDLTPEFSAIYNDPDTGDTATYYEIEVNTTSAFNGTVMWDSNKTAMSAVAQGARIGDKSYAGTTLSTNGATYYWRIRLWDNNDTVSPWSATAQFTMNNTPTAPTALLTEGATNPIKVTDLTPEFSAIFNDPDTGATALYYEIEVNTTPAFNGTVMWDSNKTAMSAVNQGARIADKSYAGTTLSLNGATLYWRIRLWDENDTVSPWSATAQFTMSSPPNAPVELTVDGYLTPTYQIFSLYPSFRAKHTDVNGDSATFYEIEINTNSAFNGTEMWDTGKQSMTSTPNNSVCPNVTYAGTMLSNSSNTYFWRIRFWDTDDTVSPWSAVGSFVDHLTNIQLEGLGLEGLGIN